MKGSPTGDSTLVGSQRGEAPESTDAPSWLYDFLSRSSVVGANTPVAVQPLAGGVSSDIFRVRWPGGEACVKRALPRLKVAADWQAPVERNRYEVEWMRVAAAVVPNAVPALIADDAQAGCFAMAWLDPGEHPVWKTLLRDGTIDYATAAAVGDVLGRIHEATADRADIASRFATDAIFDAIRLEPYLIATARAHPELSARLHTLAETTRTTRRTLVHGDFSPKNILIGSQGPIVLDAECAWYGDPAFDLAFVLNHLLLKGVWRAQWKARYVDAYRALVGAYRPHATWEAWHAFDARTAALVPALMLARVDGKSPAEYLTDDDKPRVRTFSSARIASPAASLDDVAAQWCDTR